MLSFRSEPVHISELCMDFRMIRLAIFKRQAITSTPTPITHSSFPSERLAVQYRARKQAVASAGDRLLTRAVLLVLQLTVIHHIGNLEPHIELDVLRHLRIEA